MNKLLLELVITLVTSSVMCMLLIPVIIQASFKFNLVDKPDERKVHVKPIPRLGGVGIFISTILGIVVSGVGLKAIVQWPVFFSSMAILFMIGIWDDLKNISARLRFVLQICCALALSAAGIRLTSLYGIFGVHELNAFSQYAVSVLIMVGVTNSFNLIDGIDGLAGGLALILALIRHGRFPKDSAKRIASCGVKMPDPALKAAHQACAAAGCGGLEQSGDLLAQRF